MWKDCRELQNTITEYRRDLHRIPETGGRLPATRAYVEEKLREFGIPFTENRSDDGLTAEIRGACPGKILALRADMDALPVEEATCLPFSSENPGRMHACGHDAHMAMLLGAAKVLKEHSPELKGTVRLLFQTEEENAAGAVRTIAEGGLKDVDAIFGTHIGCIISSAIPSGTVIAAPGPVMASMDKFTVRVHGEGCHGSTPEKGVDSINIAAHIVTGLQEILARELAAVKPAVLTVCHIEAGKTFNVFPSDALIEGTFRTLDEEVRKMIASRIGEIASSIASAFRGTAETEIAWGAPPVVNDPAMAALAADCAEELLGPEKVIRNLTAPTMIGEDFALYLLECPGAFLFLSSADPEKHTDFPHHSPYFDVDEDVLWEGAALFVRIAEKYLG